MKKSLIALIFVFAIILTLSAVVIANEIEAKDITISYVSEYNPSSSSTSLDKNAYENGKQTVKAGEMFTLPTTSSHSYSGKDGYQLRWYTQDGRSYKGGETVSFNEDTRLFRVSAKEVYTADELYTAMSSGAYAAVLMNDIDAGNMYISVWGENYAILDLGGYTLNIAKNGTVMGAQRSGKTIIGSGTFKVTNPDGKVGSYAVFECKGHGYNGDRNITFVGRDVTIDAPNFYLCTDGEGTGAIGYPWIKIYGTVNVNFILYRTASGNPAARVDFYETCNVTLTGSRICVDDETSKIVNNQAFQIMIYGGTFNLPASAASKDFWTTDHLVEAAPTQANKELINVMGGTFILPDGAKPAIDDYIAETYIGSTSFSVSNIVAGKETTAYVHYLIRDAYKAQFKTNGTCVFTDNMGTGLGATYYYTLNKTSDGKDVDTIVLYKDAEKTQVVDDINIKGGNVAILFELPGTKTPVTIQNIDGKYIVAPKGCEHSYKTVVTEATCVSAGSITYTCEKCFDTIVEVTDAKVEHNYTFTGDIPATLTSLGIKNYTCVDCGTQSQISYTLDPTEFEVNVKIRNDNGEFSDITVLASDVFEFTTQGVDGAYVYTLSGIKKFGDYKIRNIYGITIPNGILYVKITTQNYEKYQNVEYGVEELIIPDGANINIGNVGNLRRLKTIKVGSSNVIFEKGCCYYNPNNERRGNLLETLDVSAPNSNITFEPSAFNERKTITSLKFGENSTYVIKGSAFRYNYITDLEVPVTSTFTVEGEAFLGNNTPSIIIPDAGNVTLAGSKVFAESTTTYLYVGKNTVISSSLFQDMKYLEKVVIADGVAISGSVQNIFLNAGSADFTTPLYVYNHSYEFKNLAKNVFGNCDGIFFYTVADIGTNTEIFKDCAAVTFDGGSYAKWTIFYGIPHELVEYEIEPNCTEKGYNTWISAGQCPCGTYLTETVILKKYEGVHKISSATPIYEATYEVTAVDALGHNKLGAKTNIAYSSYLEMGDVTYVCTRCENEHTVENDADALFIFNGYSMPEDGRLLITVGYTVNNVAVSDYESINGVEIEYGVVVALYNNLDGKAPLDNTLTDVNVVKAVINKEYGSFEFVLSGFTDQLLDLEVVMSAYVIDGDKVVYLQENQNDLPVSISINKILQSETPTIQ